MKAFIAYKEAGEFQRVQTIGAYQKKRDLIDACSHGEKIVMIFEDGKVWDGFLLDHFGTCWRHRIPGCSKKWGRKRYKQLDKLITKPIDD